MCIRLHPTAGRVHAIRSNKIVEKNRCRTTGQLARQVSGLISGEKALALAVLEHAERDVAVVCGDHPATTFQPGVFTSAQKIKEARKDLIEFFAGPHYEFWCDAVGTPEPLLERIRASQLAKLESIVDERD